MSNAMVYQKQREQDRLLVKGITYADRFINRNYMVNLDMYPPLACNYDYKQFRGLRLYKMNKIVYRSASDTKEDRVNDLLTSVYGALHSLQSSALVIIDAVPNHIDFYIGISCESNASTAGLVLAEGLKGNFPGSKFTQIDNNATVNLMGKIGNNGKNISSVAMVPSLRGETNQTYLQGIERLIDAMQGETYTVMLVSEPLTQVAIEERKRGLEQLYSVLSPFAKTSLAYGDNISTAVSEGSFSSFSDSINKAVSETNSEGRNTSHGASQGTSSGWSAGGSSSSGFSNAGGSYNSGTNYSSNFGTNSSTSESTGTSTSWARSVTSGHTTTDATGKNENRTETSGESRTLTINHEDKTVSDLMEKISDHLKRIKESEIYGWWMTGAYFLSENIQTSVVAANTFRALIAGDQSFVENAFINVWSSNINKNIPAIIKYLQCGKHPIINIPSMEEFGAQQIKPVQMISGKELPFFSGLPHESVAGLMVDNIAAFGREVLKIDPRPSNNEINIGKVMHMGIVEENPVRLDVEAFRSHCFVTGSTGSGKSNTTYCLVERLHDVGIRFLIVEPAKGEYKYAFGGTPDVNIFWTNPYQFPMLHINPFSFPKNIHVLEHLDRLIEIFSACWPLRAAMPALLKTSMERIYIRHGWDLVRSEYFDQGNSKFPTFKDLVRELPILINKSSYSAQSKGDYIGALVTRVDSLTKGIMGQVFCSETEISDSVYFDENTIVDLSRVGSAETKSLLMGIMVMKLNEHRISNAEGENVPLKHITVLEEAHNLLRNSKSGGNGESDVAGKSVEMISNSIAEMRTFGEGFIIVDQSPTAVDISAIKNTNTKIVMRLPEKSDQDMVGHSFSLEDDQIKEISRLGTGMAIISQNGWLKPVLTQIDRAEEKYYCREEGYEASAYRLLVGKLCEKAIEQYKEGDFRQERLLAVIRSGKIPSQKKKELSRMISGMFERAQQSRSDLALYSFLIEISGCKGLFQLYPLALSKDKEFTSDDCKRLKLWIRGIREKLTKYLTLSDEYAENEFIRGMIRYQALIERNPIYIKGCSKI